MVVWFNIIGKAGNFLLDKPPFMGIKLSRSEINIHLKKQKRDMLMASQLRKNQNITLNELLFAGHDTHATTGGFDITLTQKPLPCFPLSIKWIGGLRG